MPDPLDLARLNLEPESEIFRLLQQCGDIEPLRYRDGEYVMREGDDARDVYLVVKGALVVERNPTMPDQPPVVLATLLCTPEQMGVVGEMAYFGAERRSASVRSSGASFALKLQPIHLDRVIAGFPDLTRIICAQFSHRLREMNRLLGMLQGKFAMTPQQRFCSPGDILFSAGDPAQELFQLVSGTVRMEGTDTSQVVGPEQLPHGLLEPEPYFQQRCHRFRAVAEATSFLVVIPRQDILAAIRHYPDLVLNVMQSA